jgi:hypothetical protein
MHKDCLKNNIKIYIKIALTCFSVDTPSSGSALSMLASTDNVLPEDGVSIMKRVRAILM